MDSESNITSKQRPGPAIPVREVKSEREGLIAALDAVDAVVYVADMTSYELLFMNKYARREFGENVGLKCWEVLQTGQSGPCEFCTNDKLIDDNGETLPPYVWELQNTVNKSWYLCHDEAIRWADGRLVRIEIATDITERHEAENALKVSVEQYRFLFEKMLDGFALHEMIYDDHGKPVDYRFLNANPAFERLTGLVVDDIIGKRVLEVIPDLDQEWIERYARVVATGEPVHFANYAESLGKEFEVSAFKTAPNQFACVFQDITPKRIADKEKAQFQAQMHHMQKLDSLGMLAGGIAHDFNNILMVILGNVDLSLYKLPPDSPVREHLEAVESATQRATALCTQMLAYSGKDSFVIEPLNINRAVEEITRMLEVSFSKKITLEYIFEENLPTIDGDASQISQIILNLVINAAEAIGDQSGLITISTGALSCDQAYLRETYLDENLHEGQYVFAEVTDTGSGMEQEIVDQIFDPFFTTKFTGRGLGLSAVLGIVRSHKGTLKIESQPGKGSSFRVLFPAAEQKAGIIRDEERSPREGFRGSGTIIVVDDEQEILTITDRMLERMGFTVLQALDGRQAVSIYTENEDDVVCVLLDLTMPAMDGAETLVELRKINGTVPVILATGYGEQDVMDKFKGAGLDGYIHKPYMMDTLKTKLREVLG